NDRSSWSRSLGGLLWSDYRRIDKRPAWTGEGFSTSPDRFPRSEPFRRGLGKSPWAGTRSGSAAEGRVGDPVGGHPVGGHPVGGGGHPPAQLGVELFGRRRRQPAWVEVVHPAEALLPLPPEPVGVAGIGGGAHGHPAERFAVRLHQSRLLDRPPGQLV